MRRHEAKGVAVPAVDAAKLGVADPYAFSSMVANTGSTSPGELLITCSTSDLAVCCSRDSFSSRLSRSTSLS